CEALAEEATPLGAEWSPSPDGRWAVRVVDANLRLLDRRSGAERQLTRDGTPQRPYATRLDWYAVQRRLAGAAAPPGVVWSPDSRRFAIERLDQSALAEAHLLKLDEDSARAELVSYREALPGDVRLAEARLWIVEVASGGLTAVQMEPLPVSVIQPLLFGHA